MSARDCWRAWLSGYLRLKSAASSIDRGPSRDPRTTRAACYARRLVDSNDLCLTTVWIRPEVV